MTASSSSATFRIERSERILADPATIFGLIEDFQRWREWSPYEHLDAQLKRGYSGASSGKGAVYTWEGNGKAGAGRMEIVETSVPDRVTIQLDFTRPMKARNKAEFVLVRDGDATRVTWSMEGAKPLLFRVMSLFMDMDKLIGRDFATGLANLKSVAEARPAEILTAS